jgi:stringent starvation protein B
MPPAFKPYLLRAYYEWCADEGFSPYIAVAVDASCRVPHAHVRGGHIVFDISMQATGGLEIGDEAITFQARFGGVAQSIYVPMHRVEGMFPEHDQALGLGFEVTDAPHASLGANNTQETAPAVAKPRFSRVK